MNYSELTNNSPYNSNTGDVTVIDFPLVRHINGGNNFVTAIDLIQFGKATDFLVDGQEATGWADTLAKIDAGFRNLNQSITALTTRLNTVQDNLTSLTTLVNNHINGGEQQKTTPTLTLGTIPSTIAEGGYVTISCTSSTTGRLEVIPYSDGSFGVSITSNINGTTHSITITNDPMINTINEIPAEAIKVNFIPTNTEQFNTLTNYTINSSAITLEVATPVENKYFYVGTTKPASLSDASVVEEYAVEQTYTNNSGAKSHVFVLTNSDKNVTFINPELNVSVDQVAVDTTTVNGYKIFETAVGLASGSSIKIQIA